MGQNNNRDRYNYEHRSDPHHDIGDSMPGTVGDSDGTLHDRLGGQPTLDEKVESFEPGAKARSRAESKNKQTSSESLSDFDGTTTTIELKDETDSGVAIGYHEGHRVRVEGARKGETALVNLEAKDGELEGSRVRLRE